MKHGHAQRGALTRTYRCWAGMLSRCRNTNDSAYHKYGGRGVSVCARWDTFENFLADMGKKPTGLTIDRIDNSRGYEPGNCRWATMKEQQNNRTNNRLIKFNDKEQTLMQWADETGISRETIARRLDKLGWPIEEALSRKPDYAPRRPQTPHNSEYFTHDGRTLTLREWSAVSGVNYECLRQRIRRYGWPIEKALTP